MKAQAPIAIQHIQIGVAFRPFVVAEMSANHNQSLERALKIVDEAARCGVHAVKIQTYTADTMTIDAAGPEFLLPESNTLWGGRSLYGLYEEAHTPWEWHEPIFERCRERGVIGFSTPFDDTAVDFLEDLDVPCYKISSFENADINLVRKVAATKKPLFISTGMASHEELQETVSAARDEGCQELVLLKCTSAYPSSPEESNILTIPHMRARHGCHVGLSDHTLGIGVAVASVALGASVIEKHFTLSRDDGGPDAAFSMEPQEMRALVKETERAWQSLGDVCYGPTATEQESLVFRRSLYFVEDMKAGDVVNSRNLRAIRPGLGLLPKYYDSLIGRVVNKDIKRGTPVDWSLLDERSD